MNTNLKYVVAIIASSYLLTGCCTNRSATQWEYLTASVSYSEATTSVDEAKTAFLNNLAKDGWVLVLHDSLDGNYIFKRAKK